MSSVLPPLVQRCDVVFASPEELAVLADGPPERTATWLLDHGVTTVVVKRGSAGAQEISSAGVLDGPTDAIPDPVDVVGAGDAFSAGWLAADLLGGPRLKWGILAARLAISAIGDTTGLPLRAELDHQPDLDVLR